MASRDDVLHKIDGSLKKHVHQNLSCLQGHTYLIVYHFMSGCRSDVYADHAQVSRLFCSFTKFGCALSLRLAKGCQHTKALCDAGCTCCYCLVLAETQVFKQSKFKSQSVALSGLPTCTCSDSRFSVSTSRLKLLDI